ncbi:cadmium resistance transporter [Enterococcus sp. DIV0800]|uniref:cadmium resistance transporter n=1 Tax=unclassified Enterococcus TaxID=2608891 RepID=UPI003D2FE096
MLQTIISGITAYISTSIDYIIILMIIFSKAKTKKDHVSIYFGDLLGTTVLVSGALTMAFVLNFVPQEWLLGFLGLIPIYMGIKLLIQGEKDTDEIVSSSLKKYNLLISTSFITIATCGADNLGIYTPLFVSQNAQQVIITLVVFFIMLNVFFFSGWLFSSIPAVDKILERYGTWISAIVYILLGLFIMIESGTIQYVFHAVVF